MFLLDILRVAFGRRTPYSDYYGSQRWMNDQRTRARSCAIQLPAGTEQHTQIERALQDGPRHPQMLIQIGPTDC